MKCDSMNIITATSYMARDIAINVLRSGHFTPNGYTIKYNLGEGLPNPDNMPEVTSLPELGRLVAFIFILIYNPTIN